MDYSHLSDSELLNLIQKENHDAFEILFRRYYSRLHQFALNYLKDEQLAYDVVQEVFIKLWEKKQNIRFISIEHLLFKMVRNHCLNYLRKIRIEENRLLHFQNDSKINELLQFTIQEDIPINIYEEEINKEMDQLLTILPEKCRKVFLLSRKEELSNAEIAQVLGCSVKNVEKHITQALKEFRKWLKNR